MLCGRTHIIQIYTLQHVLIWSLSGAYTPNPQHVHKEQLYSINATKSLPCTLRVMNSEPQTLNLIEP